MIRKESTIPTKKYATLFKEDRVCAWCSYVSVLAHVVVIVLIFKCTWRLLCACFVMPVNIFEKWLVPDSNLNFNFGSPYRSHKVVRNMRVFSNRKGGMTDITTPLATSAFYTDLRFYDICGGVPSLA